MLTAAYVFLATSMLLLLLPYLFWMIVAYGLYKAILLFLEDYKFKRNTLEEANRQLLEEKFPYYHQLNAADRKIFEKRMKDFLREKEFVVRGELSFTDEAKILLAACVNQLAFGLPPVYLTPVKKILLYSDEYPLNFDQNDQATADRSAGIIELAGKFFAEESPWPENYCNPILRQLAPALLLRMQLQTPEYDFLSEEAFGHFFNCAAQEQDRIISGAGFPLQKDTLITQEEFFGTAVEAFFERPQAFQAASPQLYEALAQLLNQNPLDKRLMAFGKR